MVLGFDATDDGKHLYAACMDGGVYRVDPATGAREQIARHESYASGASLVPKTPLLISAGYDGAVQWHDVSANKTVRKIDAHKFWSWQSAVSPDGKCFASVTGQYLAGGPRYEPAPETEPSVKVFDAQTGKTLHEFSHVPSVQAVTFSPDSRYLAAGNLMGEIRVWDLSTAKQLVSFTTPAFTSWGVIKVHCFQGGVYSLAFSHDGRSLLACGIGPMRDPNSGNGRQTWQRFAWREKGSPRTGEIREHEAGGGHPEAIAYHPSKKFFVMAGRLAQGNWNTGFFDDASGALIHSLDTKGRLTKIRFTADGTRMFLAGGVGQPKAKDGKYPDFGRVMVYDLTV
jgi:WD40 repeat protein